MLGISLAFGIGCESVATRSMKIYMQQQNWEKALDQGRQAVAETPNDFEAWFAMAQVAAQVDSLNLMMQAMDRTLALTKKYTAEVARIRTAKYNQVFNQGVQAYNAGKLADAKDRLDMAVRIEPSRPNAYKVLGMVYQRSGQTQQAIEMYARAYGADSSDATLGRQYATLLGASDQKERALATMASVFARHPGNKDVAVAYLDMLNTAGQVDSALIVGKNVLAREPQDPEVNMRVGILYMKKAQEAADSTELKADLRLAVPYFEQALVADTANTDAAYNLAISLQQLGQPERAIRPLARVIQASPRDHQARLQLAIVYLQQDDADDAEPQLRSIVDQIGEPTNAQDREVLTRAYRYLGIIYTVRANQKGVQAQQAREAAQGIRDRAQKAAKTQEAEQLEGESRDLLKLARDMEELRSTYAR